jgi:hypothetical protein
MKIINDDMRATVLKDIIRFYEKTDTIRREVWLEANRPGDNAYAALAYEIPYELLVILRDHEIS